MTGADKHEEAGREARWLARRGIGAGEMVSWSVEEWIDWWSDGMEIWFSEAPKADRELAFAPIRVNSEREDPVDAIVAVLRRFLPGDPEAMASGAGAAIERQDRIERSLIEVMGRRFDVSTEDRLLFLLQIGVTLRAKRISQIVRSALGAINSRWVEVGDLPEFLSSIARAIFEGFTSADLVSVRKTVEPLLRNEKNFRTVLNYCLKAHRDSIAECIGTFYRLWTYGQGEPKRDVWEAVSRQLNDVFSSQQVEEEVASIRFSADSSEYSTDSLVAAEKLANFYNVPPEYTEDLAETSLLQKSMEKDSDEDADENAFASRNIDVAETAS